MDVCHFQSSTKLDPDDRFCSRDPEAPVPWHGYHVRESPSEGEQVHRHQRLQEEVQSDHRSIYDCQQRLQCSAAVIRWMDVVEDHEFQEAIMPSLGKEEPADAPGQTHLSEF